MTPLEKVRSLSIWQGPIEARPLGGGITNVNFLVTDRDRQVVVRIGDDIPVHHILRFNELSASRAAHAAGVSPAVLHHEPGALVIDFVQGRTLTAADIGAPQNFDRVIDLVAQAHRRIPQHLRGPMLMFWVFHVLRDYAASLRDGASRHLALIPALLDQAQELEQAVGPVDLVFGHNDLLPANVLDDGDRLWLIDWDYAGFNSPLFDLGGLAANAGLTPAHEAHMLARYFGAAPDAGLWRRYRAMKAASALREAMWSMVQEIHSDLDFDYASYTAANLTTYHAAFAAYRDR
jgi:thiamine kinase-like enzyme